MSTARAPGPSPERVEGPTAPCGMRPTPTTQNCTLLGFRVQPPCLPPSSGEKELMAWPTSQPIVEIKFSQCSFTGPEGALEVSPRIYKGVQLYLTKNVRKKDDYVNGMLCHVEAWSATSGALQTKTGKRRGTRQCGLLPHPSGLRLHCAKNLGGQG